jgi:nicotinamidase-related amidase
MNDYVSPDWAKAALLTIDTQRDFTLPGAPAEIPGTMEVLSEMRQLVQAFRNQRKPIIHVVRLYLPDGSNADLCRRQDIEQGKRIVAPGSDGAELMDELKPSPGVKLDAEKLLAGKLQSIGPNEWLMYKPRWGAFFQTPLESHLHHLGINTIVVCGCNFPNCPRTTIYQASERDFRVVLVTDAISQIYAQGLQELKNIGVSLLNSTECLAKIGAGA